MGLRFHAVRGGMSAGVSKGGIAPDNCCEEEEDIIKDAERCIKEMHDNTRWGGLDLHTRTTPAYRGA